MRTRPAPDALGQRLDRPLAVELRGWLDARSKELIDLVCELVAAESPSTDASAQRAGQAILRDALEGTGYEVEHHPGTTSGGYLVARRPGGKEDCQLLLGHSDTVWPVGTLRDRPIRITDGRIAGPGVYDMKAGLAQMIFALRALRALGREPPLEPVVLINSDEEIGSHDSRAALEGWARASRRAFVLEPSLGGRGALKTSRKGGGVFTVTVHGRSAHAGLDPDAGSSAILELSYLIQEMFALNDRARGITVNVGMIDGGLRPNVIAPYAQALVEVRARRQVDFQTVRERIRALLPGDEETRVVIEGGAGRPVLEPTPRNVVLWEQAQAAGRLLGMELSEGLAGGMSDGNFTSVHTATLDGLGAVGGGAHAPEEHVLLEHLTERTALLGLLLLTPPQDP